MSKPAIRNLSLGSIAGMILGFVLLFLSFIGSATQTTSDPVTGTTTVHVNSVGNPALLVLSILLFIAAGIVGFIAWIGALIRTAKVQRWAWFAAILVIGPVVALIYSFVGPDAPQHACISAATISAPASANELNNHWHHEQAAIFRCLLVVRSF